MDVDALLDHESLARRSCPHLFRLDYWRDAPAAGRPGWTRTVCKRCGRFLGYRPSANSSGRTDGPGQSPGAAAGGIQAVFFD